MSDDEPLATPPGTTDMELKIKQVCMESSVLLACFAGGECLLCCSWHDTGERRMLSGNLAVFRNTFSNGQRFSKERSLISLSRTQKQLLNGTNQHDYSQRLRGFPHGPKLN